MSVRSIGIVGYGHFGKFLTVLAKRFVPDAQVKIYSRRSEPDGEVFYSLAEVAQCDVVILTGAIHEYETQLQALVPLLAPQTVVVDVATVKVHTQSLFETHLADRPWLSCHPMFGPESYSKQHEDVTGFRIVVTKHTLPVDKYEVVRDWLSQLGFVLIEMTADEHDQQLAETLFLTHYIGQTMEAGGFKRTTMDTVSFSYLMNAVESVVNDTKLFADVYQYNPYCKEVAERFHTAQKSVLASL